MLTHRLLVPGVYVLGALMVVLGLIVIAMGVPIVRMEIGWTEVVGGSVAASAGCVILAMGVLAGQLEAIRLSLAYVPAEEPLLDEGLAIAPEPTAPAFAEAPRGAEDIGFPGVPTEEPAPRRIAHPLAPQSWSTTAAPEIVRPEPALSVATHGETEPVEDAGPKREPTLAPVLNESAPALLHAEEEASHSPSVIAPDPVADPVADLPAVPAPPPPAAPAVKSRPNFLSSFLARRGIEPAPPTVPAERSAFDVSLHAPAQPTTRTPVDLSSGWDEEATEEPAPHGEHHVPLAASEPLPHGDDVHEPAQEQHAGEHHADAHAGEAVHADEQDLSPAPEPPPAEEPARSEPDPLEPVVVGRYNAGSASYVMYSNGMIEVETEQGTHQFGSMQELKNFIEKRDARVS